MQGKPDVVADFISRRFGKRTVVTALPRSGSRLYVRCLCDCGRVDDVCLSSLVHNKANMCRRCQGTINATSHGACRTPEYRIWGGIKTRCLNPDNDGFKNYGGRGITIHPPWIDSFPDFLAHIGKRPHPKLTVERIDNDLGYLPGNIKWATRKEQHNNKRTNHTLTFEGRTQTVARWSEEMGIPKSTILKRIKALFPIEIILCKSKFKSNFRRTRKAKAEARKARRSER